jgi:hypothetical protein
MQLDVHDFVLSAVRIVPVGLSDAFPIFPRHHDTKKPSGGVIFESFRDRNLSTLLDAFNCQLTGIPIVFVEAGRFGMRRRILVVEPDKKAITAKLRRRPIDSFFCFARVWPACTRPCDPMKFAEFYGAS